MTTEAEQWKAISEHYEVSNMGRVRSLRRGIILKTGVGTTGYLVVNVTGYKHKKHWKVHQLVAFHFVPNPANKPYLNHINGDKHDNRADNLEWCTNQENSVHAIKTGLRKVFKAGTKKLTEQQVIEIKRRLAAGETQVAIAESYGVARNSIKAIITGRSWRHIQHIQI